MFLIAEDKQRLKRPPTSPAKVLALGFFLIICAGTLLLMLPIATRDRRGLAPLEALFTATSATCVTGLTLVDTATTLTLFGQAVTLCLLQVGGLGFMIFATLTLVALGRRISLRNRMLIRETMNMPGLSGGVRTTLRFVFIAFSIEILGALLLSLRFVPGYGWGKGLYYGVYHAVSAFCNAGFDLFGQAGSLQGFRGDFLVLLTVSFLIMLGGLGFTVIADISDHWRQPRRMSLHSKIVLVTNGLLLLFGLCFFAAMEWDNGLTLAREGAGPGEKLLNAWFQSVTSRTAGFYSFSQSAMRDASKLVTTVLMFIGASPASTGGGVKTSTFFVGWVVLLSIAAGREDNNAFGKRLSPAIGRTAQSILFIYLTLIVLGGICLSVIEQRSGIAAIDLLFEEVSALGTVGLSAAGTAGFQTPSKLIFILLMYFGRVGPLTMMLSFSGAQPGGGSAIRYPQEDVIVG